MSLCHIVHSSMSMCHIVVGKTQKHLGKTGYSRGPRFTKGVYCWWRGGHREGATQILAACKHLAMTVALISI